MTVDAMEFIRRFLQHVLPVGLMKIRQYGFLSGSSKTQLIKVKELTCVSYEVLSGVVVEGKKNQRYAEIQNVRPAALNCSG